MTMDLFWPFQRMPAIISTKSKAGPRDLFEVKVWVRQSKCTEDLQMDSIPA